MPSKNGESHGFNGRRLGPTAAKAWCELRNSVACLKACPDTNLLLKLHYDFLRVCRILGWKFTLEGAAWTGWDTRETVPLDFCILPGEVYSNV